MLAKPGSGSDIRHMAAVIQTRFQSQFVFSGQSCVKYLVDGLVAVGYEHVKCLLVPHPKCM